MSAICAKCKFFVGGQKFCRKHEVRTCGASSCDKFEKSDSVKFNEASKSAPLENPKPRQGKCKNCANCVEKEGRLFCEYHKVKTLITAGCCTGYESNTARKKREQKAAGKK